MRYWTNAQLNGYGERVKPLSHRSHGAQRYWAATLTYEEPLAPYRVDLARDINNHGLN